jgi:nitric oxide reductase activation protein
MGNLDDFDDREVVQVPQELLDAIAEAIAHELEDLSRSVAEVLEVDPRYVAATARKADDDPERARKVTSQVKAEIQAIRRVFDRQQDTQTRHLTGLERGKVDSRRLARVGAGSLNVFRRKQVLETPDMAVGLLLDVSGSMDGWMHVIAQTAAVFAEGLARKRGINFAAWAYTGSHAHVELTRLCDRKMGKLHLANISQGGGTPSGAAIAGVQVLMARMPERKKLLLHFTDGQPDSDVEVGKAVQAARDAGIRVYAIGAGNRLGSSLRTQYGPDNWECIDRVDELPRAMANIIKRLG